MWQLNLYDHLLLAVTSLSNDCVCADGLLYFINNETKWVCVCLMEAEVIKS